MAAPRKYPDDFRERAVRMVRAHRQETGQPRGGVTQVAQQLGVNPETLRNWVNEADVEDGQLRRAFVRHDPPQAPTPMVDQGTEPR